MEVNRNDIIISIQDKEHIFTPTLASFITTNWLDNNSIWCQLVTTSWDAIKVNEVSSVPATAGSLQCIYGVFPT